MQFLSLVSTLLLLLPVFVAGQTVTLRTYQTMDRPQARIMYAFNGKAKFTPASSVTRQALAGLVIAAARDMQSKIGDLPRASYQPAAMSAFTDGSGTVWFHSSIKGAPADTNSLRTAQILTETVAKALQWCDEHGGHGNDGNCGEVGVVNMWMLETGAKRAVKETSLIVTAFVPAPPGNPYIIPPCGDDSTRGCQDFLRGVGLGNQMCQILQKRSIGSAEDENTTAHAVHRSATIGMGLGKRGDPAPKKSASTGKKLKAAKGEKLPRPLNTGGKKLLPVEKITVKTARLPKLAKVAEKFMDLVWSLAAACDKSTAGATKVKAGTEAKKDKTAGTSRDKAASVSKDKAASVSKDKVASKSKDKTAAKSKDKGASKQAPIAAPVKCKGSKKLVNGVCR